MRAIVVVALAVLGSWIARPTGPLPAEAAATESAGLAVEVDGDGARIAVADDSFGVAVRSIGRGDATWTPVREPAVRHGDLLRTALGSGATEWWRPAPSGLEHGVDLALRPTGEGPLSIDVGVTGARVVPDGDDALLVLGTRTVRYAGLVVRDARGQALPSRLIAHADGIELSVDDEGAAYPIVVDPLVAQQEATFTDMPSATGDQFGREVSLSADGRVAAVASTCTGPCSGFVAHVQMFRRTGTSWTFDGLLSPFAGGSFAHVAVSGDGSRVAIEGGVFSGTGGLRIYGYASGWNAEQTIAGSTSFPVSFSADATRILRGNQIWLRSGTTWSLETTLPTPVGANVSDVAMSGDGLHAIVSVSQVGGSMFGDVRSFVRSGSSWSLEATVLSVMTGVSFVVATDDTGTRVAVGRGDYGVAGSVGVYVRSGATWTSEATITPGDTHAGDRFGADLSLSGDGARLLVGAPDSGFGGMPMIPAGPGTMRLFTRSASSWSAALTIHRSSEANGDDFGTAVAISGDGARALGGAPGPAGTAVGGRPGNAAVFRLGDDLGTACSTAASCASGFCVDGVCCDTACGSGATNDCVACSAALTGGVAGTCAALSAAAAPTVTCRVADDLCDQAETCVAGSSTCPADVARTSGAVCHAPTGTCDLAEVCDGTHHQCPGDAVATAGTVCRSAVGTCDVEERCDGTSAACPADALRSAGYVCLAGTPGTCDTDDVCDGASTACPQRFASASTPCGPAPVLACDAPDHCSGTSADCIALVAPLGMLCRAAAGGCDVDEACDGLSPSCPIDVYRLAGATCRASLGACDPAETCEGGPTCPANALAPPGAVCRPAAGSCDAAETCSGLGAGCPVDAVAGAGTVCRAAIGTCDVADTCDGIATACPTDAVLASGSICRASLGGCDPAERCDGTTGACPGDARSAAGTQCGGATASSCSTPGTCDGTAVSCPGATPLAAGHVCLAADARFPCDVDDVCDGTTDVCAPRYAPSTQACGAAPSGACDAPDHCAGTSADCVDTFASGVECRASTGACDPAEACTGGAAACPPDQVQPAGTGCRDSTGPTCDPAEVCDGLATSCPADVNTCSADAGMTTIDAGTDAGPRDAGSGLTDVSDFAPDAATTPPPSNAGCGCGVARSTSRGWAVLLLGLVVALRRRR